MVIEQIEATARREAEQRAEMLDRDRRTGFRERRVQALGQPLRARVQAHVEIRIRLFELRETFEHRERGRHRQRMLREGAREEDRRAFRIAVVAIAPPAAVDAVHAARAARDHADRHAAADDLAVRAHIGAHAEIFLRAAARAAEPGNHLVEHQHDAARLRERAQPLEERARPQRRRAALHRLHQHDADLRVVRVEIIERSVVAVVEHDRVRDERIGRAEAGRPGLAMRAATREHAVEAAVVRVAEDHELVAARREPSEPDRGHRRLGARIAEHHALVAGEARDPFGHAPRERRLRPDRHADVELRAQRIGDEGRPVPEQVNAETHREIDVAVTVDVDDVRPLGAGRRDRVHEFLQQRPEAGRHAVVRERRAVGLRERLRGAQAGVLAGGERIEMRAGARIVAAPVRFEARREGAEAVFGSGSGCGGRIGRRAHRAGFTRSGAARGD